MTCLESIFYSIGRWGRIVIVCGLMGIVWRFMKLISNSLSVSFIDLNLEHRLCINNLSNIISL